MEVIARRSSGYDEAVQSRSIAKGEKGIRVYSVGPNRHDDGGIKRERGDDIIIGVEAE